MKDKLNEHHRLLINVHTSLTIAPAAATCSQMYHNLHKNELMYTRNKLHVTVLGPHSSYHINQPLQDTVNTYMLLRRGTAAQSVINESSLEIKTVRVHRQCTSGT